MARNKRILILLLIMFLLSAFACLFMGSSSLSLFDLFTALRNGDAESAALRIFRFVRLPRMLAAMLAGAALSTAGMLLQSVLRNPLAAFLIRQAVLTASNTM